MANALQDERRLRWRCSSFVAFAAKSLNGDVGA
jgi:hypothetical protein